jgi:hypothetical protein
MKMSWNADPSSKTTSAGNTLLLGSIHLWLATEDRVQVVASLSSGEFAGEPQ